MASPTPGSGEDQDQYWPLPKFYFSVDIGDFTDLSFQEISGLDISTESVEYRHGNSPNGSINMPSMIKYGDVTLKKGVFTSDNQFYDWVNSVKLNTFKRFTVVIRLLNQNGEPETTWELKNAFPIQVTPTDMNSSASEAAIESIVFSHEGLKIII
jgi:phage tail-like protein